MYPARQNQSAQVARGRPTRAERHSQAYEHQVGTQDVERVARVQEANKPPRRARKKNKGRFGRGLSGRGLRRTAPSSLRGLRRIARSIQCAPPRREDRQGDEAVSIEFRWPGAELGDDRPADEKGPETDARCHVRLSTSTTIVARGDGEMPTEAATPPGHARIPEEVPGSAAPTGCRSRASWLSRSSRLRRWPRRSRRSWSGPRRVGRARR